MDRQQTLVFAVTILAIIGMLIAGYSTLAHYNVASSDFCSIGESLDCGFVNQSSYSKLYGIPVAVLGLLSYTVFLVGIWLHRLKKQELVLTGLGFLATIALGFSLYLTSIEAFVLKTWCLLCVGSQIVALLLFITIFTYRHYELKLSRSGSGSNGVGASREDKE